MLGLSRTRRALHMHGGQMLQLPFQEEETRPSQGFSPNATSSGKPALPVPPTVTISC